MRDLSHRATALPGAQDQSYQILVTQRTDAVAQGALAKVGMRRLRRVRNGDDVAVGHALLTATTIPPTFLAQGARLRGWRARLRHRRLRTPPFGEQPRVASSRVASSRVAKRGSLGPKVAQTRRRTSASVARRTTLWKPTATTATGFIASKR